MSRSRDYQVIPDMPPVNPASWKSFFLVVNGSTHNAHRDVVRMLERNGHYEVNDPEGCDYCLLVFPVVTRFKTDMDEALRGIPGNKPTVVVALHHTRQPSFQMPECMVRSEDVRVHLTVTYLFFEQNLLRCDVNNKAEKQIQEFFRFPQGFLSIFTCSWPRLKLFVFLMLVLLAVVLMIVFLGE